MDKRKSLVLFFPFLVMTLGCSGGPKTVAPVDVDPSSAAEQAMELYDSNSDGFLDDDELVAVPGILSAKSFYDKDTDGQISGQEIQDRLERWKELGLGFRPLTILITLDGKPLDAVDVKLIPEPYLGDAVKPASGKTMADGAVVVSVEPEDLPAALKSRPKKFHGVTGGTYKVELNNASQDLPAKFNTKTTLGVEVATDTILANYYMNLKSK